jgi:hypothetical protein
MSVKPVAQDALVRARQRGARIRNATQVKGERQKPEPLTFESMPGSGSRLMYLEGRRHAIAIVSDGAGLLKVIGGKSELLDRLRRCSKGKPGDFARGILDVACELDVLT